MPRRRFELDETVLLAGCGSSAQISTFCVYTLTSARAMEGSRDVVRVKSAEEEI